MPSDISRQTRPAIVLPQGEVERTFMVTILDTINPEARRIRHPEKAHKPDTEVLRKPEWIRVRAPTSKGYAETRSIVKEHKLVTVCEEAGCPNIGECWDKKHATFMIMGEICTRACAFCNVSTGRPNALDMAEPENVAKAVKQMGLSHVVITSVDRDDLEDGGAEHFEKVIWAIRAASPSTTIEILTPDFLKKPGALERVVAAKPDVFNHNMETVPGNYLTVRPGALLPFGAPAAAVKRNRPDDVHSGIGRPWRGTQRSAAIDGRPAHRRRRLPHHRPIPPADPQAPPGNELRHTGRIQVL